VIACQTDQNDISSDPAASRAKAVNGGRPFLLLYADWRFRGGCRSDAIDPERSFWSALVDDTKKTAQLLAPVFCAKNTAMNQWIGFCAKGLILAQFPSQLPSCWIFRIEHAFFQPLVQSIPGWTVKAYWNMPLQSKRITLLEATVARRLRSCIRHAGVATSRRGSTGYAGGRGPQ
jgi:hypothetical protein